MVKWYTVSQASNCSVCFIWVCLIILPFLIITWFHLSNYTKTIILLRLNNFCRIVSSTSFRGLLNTSHFVFGKLLLNTTLLPCDLRGKIFLFVLETNKRTNEQTTTKHFSAKRRKYPNRFFRILRVRFEGHTTKLTINHDCHVFSSCIILVSNLAGVVSSMSQINVGDVKFNCFASSEYPLSFKGNRSAWITTF